MTKRQADGSRHRDRRRAEADARTKEMTPEQQLTLLDDRLGSGQGALKERAELTAQLTKETPA